MTKRRATRDAMRELYAGEWVDRAAAYHAAPDDFYTAWWYLHHHPIFNDLCGMSYFDLYLDIYAARVDPTTLTVEDDQTRNTRTRIWLEHGPVYLKEDAPLDFWGADMDRAGRSGVVPSHDIELDCDDDTYEQAIITLAATVSTRYGDDRRRVYAGCYDD